MYSPLPTDALIVLLKHFHPATPLSAEDEKAIAALNAMLGQIADVKEKHDRPALRPHAQSASA